MTHLGNYKAYKFEICHECHFRLTHGGYERILQNSTLIGIKGVCKQSQKQVTHAQISETKKLTIVFMNVSFCF